MKHYDLAFSCGYACAITQALRAAGLQFASFPFDWTASQGFRACARMMADGFAHWMDREDLMLTDIRRGGFNKHVYRSRRNGFAFPHDFSSFKTFDESYPKVAEKYARRIARFDACLKSAKKVLAVCAEWPLLDPVPDETLLDVRRIMESAYPGVSVDLVYLHVKDGAARIDTREVVPGITVATYDYRKFNAYGELDHEMEYLPLVAWLKANVSVPDPRTEGEKSGYQKDWAAQDAARWKGRNWWESFVNRAKYRQYRRLEKFLVAKGLVPRERPTMYHPRAEDR